MFHLKLEVNLIASIALIPPESKLISVNSFEFFAANKSFSSKPHDEVILKALPREIDFEHVTAIPVGT